MRRIAPLLPPFMPLEERTVLQRHPLPTRTEAAILPPPRSRSPAAESAQHEGEGTAQTSCTSLQRRPPRGAALGTGGSARTEPGLHMAATPQIKGPSSRQPAHTPSHEGDGGPGGRSLGSKHSRDRATAVQTRQMNIRLHRSTTTGPWVPRQGARGVCDCPTSCVPSSPSSGWTGTALRCCQAAPHHARCPWDPGTRVAGRQERWRRGRGHWRVGWSPRSQSNVWILQGNRSL